MTLPALYDELTWEQKRDVRNEYVRRQNGLCQHCGEPLNSAPSEKISALPINWRLFPPKFRKHPVHLHHSHDTGLTIGAVHNQCNAVLWQYHGE